MNFNTFFFHPQIAAGIEAAHFSTPTPIQIQAIPKIMQGSDLIGLAQTGTGKTAAFVLPILNRIKNSKRGAIRALIMAPTRELAEQIYETVDMFGKRAGIKGTAIYGGVGFQPQVKALKKADVVVACPGRLLDHIRRNTIDLKQLEVLVLDEADHMFDMGFLPDIKRILACLPNTGRQTLLFSATMPSEISKLSRSILKNPEKVKIATGKPADTVKHALYQTDSKMKTASLLKLLNTKTTDAVLVFTRTKHRAVRLSQTLLKAGYHSTSLQGNLSQNKRQEAISDFKSGKIKILVATDIASRGIDISNVSHVINYDMPSTTDTYIHRIGRTGRAERKGEALTLVTDEDRDMIAAIGKVMGKPIEKVILHEEDIKRKSTFHMTANKKDQKKNDMRPFKKAGKKSRKPYQRSSKGAFSWFVAQEA